MLIGYMRVSTGEPLRDRMAGVDEAQPQACVGFLFRCYSDPDFGTRRSLSPFLRDNARTDGLACAVDLSFKKPHRWLRNNGDYKTGRVYAFQRWLRGILNCFVACSFEETKTTKFLWCSRKRDL